MSDEAKEIFFWIVFVALAVAGLIWWRGYYMQSCIADGHTYSWCNAQFWHNL
jgi:hypothetical protein